jgi:hypothetical protein
MQQQQQQQQQQLSVRGRLTLEALQCVWSGQPLPWVELLATVPMPVPQELLGAATQPPPARSSAHPLAQRRMSAKDIRDQLVGAASSDQVGTEEELSGWQWWSGGRYVYSANAQCSAFFECMFQTIRDTPVVSGEQVDGLHTGSYSHALSYEDLFHGHVFTVHPAYTAMNARAVRQGGNEDGEGHQEAEAGQPAGMRATAWLQQGQGEVGVVFHAKEYPSDLMPMSNGDSGFSSEHPAYWSRNVVWLASTNAIYVWRPPLIPSRWEGILQLGTEWDEMSEELRQILTESYSTNCNDNAAKKQEQDETEDRAVSAAIAPHRRAYTLSEAGFRELGAIPATTDVAVHSISTVLGEPHNGADNPIWNPWECDVNLLLQLPVASEGGDGGCNSTVDCETREPVVKGVIFAWSTIHEFTTNGVQRPHTGGPKGQRCSKL